jgi:hypothetical protein
LFSGVQACATPFADEKMLFEQLRACFFQSAERIALQRLVVHMAFKSRSVVPGDSMTDKCLPERKHFLARSGQIALVFPV